MRPTGWSVTELVRAPASHIQARMRGVVLQRSAHTMGTPIGVRGGLTCRKKRGTLRVTPAGALRAVSPGAWAHRMVPEAQLACTFIPDQE